MKCPICRKDIGNIKTEWTLKEWKKNDHEIASIGTSHNAPEHLQSTVEFQIASNLAAYNLNYDETINLGFIGTAYIRCPDKRPIGEICIES